MKQLTINIPDYYYQTFMDFFKNIPEANLVSQSNFVLTKEHLDILEQRSKTPKEQYISREQLMNKIKRTDSE